MVAADGIANDAGVDADVARTDRHCLLTFRNLTPICCAQCPGSLFIPVHPASPPLAPSAAASSEPSGPAAGAAGRPRGCGGDDGAQGGAGPRRGDRPRGVRGEWHGRRVQVG